ncbi:MAG TPA: HU family DNA-binding protein [Paludibacteraceae bacterium]|nr:HU family DNA-binding protein [Paludibacteraceae bacterium]
MENKKQSIQELVDIIATQTNFTKKNSEEFLKEFVHVLQEYLEKDGFVKVKGLGTFKLVKNEERKSVNVTTGEAIIIPAHNKVSFIPDNAIKEAVNKPYAHLETITVDDDTKNSTIDAQPDNTVREEKSIQDEAKNNSIPNNTVIQHEKPSNNSKKTTKNKKKNPVAIVILLLLFHVAMAVSFYFYKTEIVSFFQRAVTIEENDLPQATIIDKQLSPVSIVADTVVVVETDSMPDTTNIQQPDEIIATYTPELAQNAPIKEYVTVNEGSRLTWIAYKAYGHKAFWVYIYDANRNQLKTPNDVKIGMELAIPELDASLVNPNDENCVIKALELAEKYK